MAALLAFIAYVQFTNSVRRVRVRVRNWTQNCVRVRPRMLKKLADTSASADACASAQSHISVVYGLLRVCRRYAPRYCFPGSDVTYHRAGGVSAMVVLACDWSVGGAYYGDIDRRVLRLSSLWFFVRYARYYPHYLHVQNPDILLNVANVARLQLGLQL